MKIQLVHNSLKWCFFQSYIIVGCIPVQRKQFFFVLQQGNGVCIHILNNLCVFAVVQIIIDICWTSRFVFVETEVIFSKQNFLNAFLDAVLCNLIFVYRRLNKPFALFTPSEKSIISLPGLKSSASSSTGLYFFATVP